MNLDELKIDDRVGYERTGFGVVTKINDHGHITIILCGYAIPQFKVFDKHGEELKRGCSATRLCSAESLTRRLAEQKDDNAKQQAVQDILDYIAGRRCGDGRYHIDESSKDKIKLLAAQL